MQDVFATLRAIAKEYEVIVIDDGSQDGSRVVLKKLAKKYKNLKLVFHEKNKGYGGALRSGFAAATKDLVFYTDGDGQYVVKELPALLSLMTDDVHFVNGIKMPRQDPTIRLVIGNLYALFVRWAFWLPIYDVDCDFRLIRSGIIKKLNLKSNSGSICVELVKKAQRAGAKFRQVSVHHYERRFGSSQFFRPGRILRTLLADVGLWLELMVWDKLVKS